MQTSAKPQALVTGGTRGIGKAICLELASRGYDIAFTYKSSQHLADELSKECEAKFKIRAKGFQADVADCQSWEATLDQILKDFPNVEVLVNNAGISIDGLSMRFKMEDFDQLMNTNVRGAFIACQAVTRPMMKQKKGSIIFISSVIGQMGNSGQVPYATTKAALFGMMKSLAKELGSRNIRVNAITPGFISTDMTESLPQASKEAILSDIPLGHFGESKDIAHAVAFLAGSESTYVTGQVLAVNGGLYV